MRFSVPSIFALLTAVPLVTASVAPAQAEPVEVLPVVELFTSQGCSSCPPADRLLGTLAKRDDLIALSFNVDYWDYLGWKDTLAKSAFTARQRSYARERGDGQVYTPQMVMNGRAHFVGSNRRALKQAVSTNGLPASFRPAVSLTKEGRVAQVTIGEVPGWSGRATVWIAAVQPAVTTKIKRGENRGRKITYANVVRDLIPVGTWMGKSMTVQLDPNMIMKNGASRCALIIQQGATGPILAAAWLD